MDGITYQSLPSTLEDTQQQFHPPQLPQDQLNLLQQFLYSDDEALVANPSSSNPKPPRPKTISIRTNMALDRELENSPLSRHNKVIIKSLVKKYISKKRCTSTSREKFWNITFQAPVSKDNRHKLARHYSKGRFKSEHPFDTKIRTRNLTDIKNEFLTLKVRKIADRVICRPIEGGRGISITMCFKR